jgi:hypothetical protein
VLGAGRRDCAHIVGLFISVGRRRLRRVRQVLGTRSPGGAPGLCYGRYVALGCRVAGIHWDAFWILRFVGTVRLGVGVACSPAWGGGQRSVVLKAR